jgi:hypothetical protein
MARAIASRVRCGVGGGGGGGHPDSDGLGFTMSALPMLRIEETTTTGRRYTSRVWKQCLGQALDSWSRSCRVLRCSAIQSQPTCQYAESRSRPSCAAKVSQAAIQTLAVSSVRRSLMRLLRLAARRAASMRKGLAGSSSPSAGRAKERSRKCSD